MDTPRDEAWERELKLANESRDYWHGEYMKLNAVLRDAVKLLNGRGEYTAARKEGGDDWREETELRRMRQRIG